MDILTVKEKLEDNFAFIQRKIEDIKMNEKIDIKQISDFQRYVDIQERTLRMLATLR